MTTPGYTWVAGYYTDVESLPDDYTIGNFDIHGYVQSFLRPRFNIFAVGEAQTFVLYGGPWVGSTYEIRDYHGNIVRSGSAAVGTLTLSPALPPGAYRMYLRRPTPIADWGTAQGGCHFIVWRATAGFHANKILGDPISSYAEGGSDLTLRSVMLGGVQRFSISDAAAPGASVAQGTLGGALADIETAKVWYTPFDTERVKPLLVNFPNYNNLAGENDGVSAVVTATMDDVRYYEGRNEPDGMGAAAWLPKQAAFYAAVKAADPTAKVLGPCPTSVSGPTFSGTYSFLREFLELGGADYIDAFSFHDYNNIWGDLVLGRQCYGRMMRLLERHGLQDIEKWMTECGAGAANFGVFSPRLQGRFIMMSLQIQEQFGIPKERVNYFYDASHGFWSVPTWYSQWEMTFYPPVSLIRVWSEELLGKNFAEAYGFDAVQDNWTIGSRFEAADGSSVAAFSSSGRTDEELTLGVRGTTDPLVIVSPFGVESTLPVVGGQITLPIDNGIPTYVRLPIGVSLRTVSRRFGPNLALNKTVTVLGSGAGASKVTDGILRSWYLDQQGDSMYGESAPFSDDHDLDAAPGWLVVDFGGATTIDTVVVMCPPPYSFQGTLTDYDLQRWNGSTWVTLDTVTEDTTTLVEPSDQNLSASQVETYFAERSVFVHEFTPVSTSKIRLWVRDATFGAYADQLASDVRGENWPHVMQIRSIQAYNRSGLPAPKYVRTP